VFDDLGSQGGPLMSLADYRKFYKPYQREIIKRIKTYLRPEAKIILKSCGSIYQFIPDFIEIGVDVLSPVQPLAQNMDPWRLKREFGKDLSFLGGLDLQRLLSFGSVDQIEHGVRILMKEYAQGGGYVFGASYIIPCNVSPDKIVSMFDAAYKYGEYPISRDIEEISFVEYIDGLNLSDTLSGPLQAPMM
jgi:uroporphyrinogen decarboxylase